jgi:signal transduction histidine kinase/DNA-binding response OmpR family regulator
VTDSKSFAACSSAHVASRVLDCRQACLAELQKFLDEPIGVAGLDACLAFIAGNSDADRGTTFAAVEKAISETNRAGLHPLRWHDVLRPIAITLERRATAGSPVEPYQHRLLQIQERISAVSARLEVQERIRTAQEGNALRVLGGALVSARGLGAIGPVLEAALPGLGVSLCYVCMFDHEAPSPRQASVVVRYAPRSIDRGVLMHRTAELWQELPRSVPPPPTPPARRPSMQFEITDLLPPKLALEVKRRDLLVYPLVFARDALGYVVFDPPARLAGAWVLDGVASHLSSALHAILNAARLRDAREAAEAASAAKSEFVAIMSHEIRTPMTAMLGHLELCLRTQLTRDQRHHVEQARVSSRALLEIVNDLLDFSKVEAQRLELERERFSLDDVLTHVASTCGVAAASKSLELVVDVERYVPDVLFGDSLRLGQVLINLVGNAIKFSASGVVVLDVARTHPSATDEVLLTFSVKDSGIGMSEEQLARVFQPFAQADSSTTRRYGGTGLGLTIAQRFVRLMGGELEVKSRTGEGSVFSFTAAFGRDDFEAPAPQEGLGVRVLIVEDCARQRDALKRMLQAYAYTVDAADTPDHALTMVTAAADRLVYHLVLVDETLPGMSGRALAREFHRHFAVIQGPIVLLGQRTADAAGTDDTCGGDAASMVFKPVSRSTLRDLGRSAGRMRVDVETPPHLAMQALPELAGCRVLLVQDDPVSREALREMLRLYGLRVDTAGDGGEVLRLCRTTVFDVVLLDLGLPGVDGYTVSAALRMDPRYSHVPIIALTASSGVEVRQRSLAAGMNDCVTTPVESERLASLIAVSLRDPGPAMVEGLRRTQSSAALRAVRPPAELDATAAVKRLGDNWELFRRLLRRFIEDQQEAVVKVRRWLEAGDRPRAERYAHSLVSAAGNIGAMQLSAAAHALEITLRRRIGDPPPQVLEDFAVALSAALKAADEALGRLSADQAPAVVVDDVLPALRTLRKLLTAYDTRAVEHLDRLLPAMVALAGHAAVRKLEQSVRGYDFAAALSELDRLTDIVEKRLTDAKPKDR